VHTEPVDLRAFARAAGVRGCSIAVVTGAVLKVRYERELVLTTSSVRCQAKTADLLPSGN